MSDLGRCANPDCSAKWDREANQECPSCGTVYVPPEPYEDAPATYLDGQPIGAVSVESLEGALTVCVMELRKRGWSWKSIDVAVRGQSAQPAATS